MQKILEDLNTCDRLLLKLKTDFHPMYKSLLIFWTRRRDELKRQLAEGV